MNGDLGKEDALRILENKKTHYQIEKVQISRILPELEFLLNKIKKFDGSLESDILYLDKGHFFSSDAPKVKWVDNTKLCKELIDLMKQLINSRIFNIESERKEIINKFIISKLEKITNETPTYQYEIIDKLTEIRGLLSEIEGYFSSIISCYDVLLK